MNAFLHSLTAHGLDLGVLCFALVGSFLVTTSFIRAKRQRHRAYIESRSDRF